MPTVRQQMIMLLCDREMGARELSQELHVSEKEVYGHLSHITRSVVSHRQRFVMTPARCLSCSFRFRERKRPTPPSRCPRCKSERIEEPAYRIV